MEISSSHGCNAGLVTKDSDHEVETGVTKTKKYKKEYPDSQLHIDFLLAIASFFCRLHPDFFSLSTLLFLCATRKAR